jgi:hypothetical protein
MPNIFYAMAFELATALALTGVVILCVLLVRP